MDIDDLTPAQRSEPLAALVAEDLDRLSQGELAARIAVLEGEIVRVAARMATVERQRASADALFRK